MVVEIGARSLDPEITERCASISDDCLRLGLLHSTASSSKLERVNVSRDFNSLWDPIHETVTITEREEVGTSQR